MLKGKNKKNVTELRRGLITREDSKSPISEQYRTLRTNIEFSMVDQQLKTFICTSSNPGEGKTTTLSNLAVVFAQQGKKILFVDADLRKPTAHYIFQVENQFGLTSVLTKKETLEKAIVSTTIENVSILPSGPIPPNPSELLGSKAMKELVEEMSDLFDMILFDTPPVLAVTDAQVLGNTCDGALFVVKSNQTAKDELIKAKELLEKANVYIVGVVLNGKKEDINLNYYYGK